MTILDRIVAHKREEVRARLLDAPLEIMQARASGAARPRDLVAALGSGPGVALIAEVKRASPSKGLLCPDFDPVRLATTYVQNGAAAISVLTDEAFFQGSLADLAAVRQAVGGAVPILRKDFVIHPFQVYEARAGGADALLLIAAILTDEVLAGLLSLTRALGMTALVEVHDRGELERVLPLSPRLVGVNSRNLCDFSVDLQTCLSLRPLAPDSICFVAESGIHGSADVKRLAGAGIDGMLVGEALVTAPDVGAKVRELVHGGQS
jgi:indole-3-glycerol phosphate synthase